MRVDWHTGEVLDPPRKVVFRDMAAEDDGEDWEDVELDPADGSDDPAEDLPVLLRDRIGVWVGRLAPVAVLAALAAGGIALLGNPGPVVVAVVVLIAVGIFKRLDGDDD